MPEEPPFGPRFGFVGALPPPEARLVVLDTMVVVGSLMGTSGGSASAVLDAVERGEISLALSDDYLKELRRVVNYDHVRRRIPDPARAFLTGLETGVAGFMCRTINYDWPTVPDPKDRWVLDLANASGADHIVTRDRHFLDHAGDLEAIGFRVLTPRQFLGLIRPNA